MSNVRRLSWFKMRAAAGVGTINIFGEIGGYGVNFQSFQRQLDELGPVSEIKLTINSDGGDVYQGFAIYQALALHPAKKTVTVMGLAASMASVVLMAGDSRIMPKNSTVMIHNPVGQVTGESDEIIAFGEAVGDMRKNIAQAYVDAADGKLSMAKALSLMDKQSWLGAEQCLALGLCTAVSSPVSIAAKFDLSHYANAPKSYGDTKGKVMPKSKDEDFEARAEADAEAVAETKKEAKAELRAEQAQVNALCRIAGKPELAAKFNEDGKTVDEVVAELDKLKSGGGTGGGGGGKGKNGKAAAVATADVEISARHAVDTEDEHAPVIDPDKIWNQWNKTGKANAA